VSGSRNKRRSRNTTPVVIALAAIVLPLIALAIMAAWQTRHISDALNARQLETMRQSARFASRELAYVVAQREGDVLTYLAIESPEALAASLSIAEAAFPGVVCFALLQDGTFLYPEYPDEVLDGPGADGEIVDAGRRQIAFAARHRSELFQRLEPHGVCRVYLRSTDDVFMASLHEMHTTAATGMVGVCWNDEHLSEWGQAVARGVLSPGYVLEIADREGRLLFPPARSGESHRRDDRLELNAECPMREDMFPWIVQVRPLDPGEVSGMIRRQIALYVGVLILLCVFIAVGVWMLVSVTLREMELGRLKADFAANVSHELRTPLALVRAAGDALALRGDLDSAQRTRYLEIIRRESRRLTDLIGTVLSFSRIERREQGLELVPTDVCRLVREFMAPYETRAEEEGFGLQIRVPDQAILARADPGALHLVLANLLGNAIKFSPDRKNIVVEVEERRGGAAVSVTDQGIGVAPADQERIFDSFFRSEGDLVKKTRGTGIGLSLAREIVRAHGGRITVNSAPGRGSTFTVELPAAPQREQETTRNAVSNGG
jgi:signal transduction histidine kinase